MNKKQILFFVGLLIVLILGYAGMCKYDAVNLRSTYDGFTGNKKIVKAGDGLEKGILSYGPYAYVDDGRVLILINYVADTEGNDIDVVSISSGKKYYVGSLNVSRRWNICMISTDQIDDLEIRTYYGGQGNFEVKSYYIIQLKYLGYIFGAITALVSIYYILEKSQYIYRYVFALAIFLVLNLISVQLALFLSYLYVFPLLYIFYKKGKTRHTFMVANVLALSWLELFNYQFYLNSGISDMKVSFFSWLAFFAVYYAVFYVIKGDYKWKKYVAGVFTAIVLIYSSAQYIYFSLFGNYFKLKAVLLLSTATGATSSIEELLGRFSSVCYLLNIAFFVIVYVLACICNSRPELLEKISGIAVRRVEIIRKRIDKVKNKRTK